MSRLIAGRIARREMRGGLRGFRVFLACLALGVAAIAAVGTVRTSIENGIARNGASILGGDAEIELTYRFASDAERLWMQVNSDRMSEIVDFRSMVVVEKNGDTDRALTQVKGVDGAYPLFGSVILSPDMSLATALEGRRGLPGAVMDGLLVRRLNLLPGDVFKLGGQKFVLAASLVREPDNATGTFSLGPRTIVRTSDLAQSGLLQPGTLFESRYRLAIAENTDLDELKLLARAAITGGGLRWRDRRDGAPGVSDFVDHLSAFLILVGLAGLAVGGVGISAAVRTYLEEKIHVIATLKTLGAEASTIMQIYLIQIGGLTLIGISAGLVLGVSIPLALAPLIEAKLPVPVEFSVYLRPLFEAALFGTLSAVLFSVWPVSRTEKIHAATLFRDASLGIIGLPRKRYIIFTAAVLVALVASAAGFSGDPLLSIWAAVGLFAVFLFLSLTTHMVKAVARTATRVSAIRGIVPLHLALRSVGGPGGEAMSIVLSLGLGLSVLATIGQIDTNLRSAIERDLPDIAPLFFVVDIQPDQLDPYRALVQADPDVTRLVSAPMLRGVITKINGQPAADVVGDYWVVTGDRGVTYSAEVPPGTNIVSGEWWPVDYAGEPQISFSADEAKEMGLKLGDSMTVNILGRDITAKITSLRDVDFSNASMGFVLSMNPGALAGAPHSYISTIYAKPTSEARLLGILTKTFPNITTISVRSVIERVAGILEGIAAAITYGALATLVTGGVVLIGAAAAGERARTYEAAVLKTLGASRGQVIASFLLRSMILGAAAGAVAVGAGALAARAVLVGVMETSFEFAPLSALVIVSGGIVVTLLASTGFSLRSLNARPSAILRARE